MNKHLIMDLSSPACSVTETNENVNFFLISYGRWDQVPTSQHSGQSPLESRTLSSLIFCHFFHDTTLKQSSYHYPNLSSATSVTQLLNKQTYLSSSKILDAFQTLGLCIWWFLRWNILLYLLSMNSPARSSFKISNSCRGGLTSGTSYLY